MDLYNFLKSGHEINELSTEISLWLWKKCEHGLEYRFHSVLDVSIMLLFTLKACEIDGSLVAWCALYFPSIFRTPMGIFSIA